MRDRRGPLPAVAAEKYRREGALSLLCEAPVWLGATGFTELSLRARRRVRRARYRRAGMVAVPDPTATIDVAPASVERHVSLARFDEASPRALLGVVRGGDWDRGLPRVEAQPKYRACAARVEGDSWEETGIIDRLAAELAASDAETIEHGCGSRADLLRRYETEREDLYRTLREEGYDRSLSPVCCRVHIGRDGDLLFGSGGRHRFYLSRLVGIDSIPVEVLVRHAEWQSVRDAVAAAETVADLSPAVRRHLGHPDLREFDFGDDDAREFAFVSAGTGSRGRSV